MTYQDKINASVSMLTLLIAAFLFALVLDMSLLHGLLLASAVRFAS